MAALTRNEVLQSLAFQTFFSLPNAIKAAAMQHMIDESITMFEGWEAAATNVAHAGVVNPLAADDIVTGAVSNNAETGGDITQDVYFFTPA